MDRYLKGNTMTIQNLASRLGRPAAAILAAAGAVLLGGCMTSTPNYDQHFAEAVRTARAMQVLNPDGPMNPDPVSGIDGRAATFAQDRYGQSFRNPPQDTNAYTVGVGGSSGSP